MFEEVLIMFGEVGVDGNNGVVLVVEVFGYVVGWFYWVVVKFYYGDDFVLI